MSSWRIHNKWCQELGIKKEICNDVNKIIDDPSHHDVVKSLLRRKGFRYLFESGKMEIISIGQYEKFTRVLSEIINKFGEDGIKATFSHIALDRIAELIKLGFNKEDILKKITEDKLMEYIPNYEHIFLDISEEVKPSHTKIQRMEAFKELARKRIYGIFKVDNQFLPPTPALIKIKSKLDKGEKIIVKWGISAYDMSRNRYKISKILSKPEDLKELIEEVSIAQNLLL